MSGTIESEFFSEDSNGRYVFLLYKDARSELRRTADGAVLWRSRDKQYSRDFLGFSTDPEARRFATVADEKLLIGVSETIIDRRGLIRRSCECYGVSKEEFDRLLDDRATRKVRSS